MTEENYDTYSEFKEEVENNYAEYDTDLFPGYYSSKADFNGSSFFGDATWPPETPENYTDNTRGKKFYGLFDVRYYCTWNAEDVNLPAFSSTNIIATLQDKNGTPLKNVDVSYQYNQQNEVTTTTDNQGKITIPYTAQNAGKQTLTFKYNGSKEYIPCTKTITITITKLTPTLQVNNVQVYVNNTTTVSATLLQDNTPMKNKTVKITVQGETYTLTTNSYGIVTTPSFNNPSTGSYTITAEYTPSTTTVAGIKDSDNYNSVSQTASLTVISKEQCTLTIGNINSASYGDTISIILTLKDKSGTAITGVKPTLKVNNTLVTVPNNTDSNGNTSISYTVNSTGKLDIYSSFSNYKYAETTATRQVPINNIPTTLAEYTNRKESDGNDLLVTLRETESHEVLANQQIKFYDGTEYLDTVTTDSNGLARCNGAFLSIGTHTIRATFEGTNLYAASSTTFTLNATFLVDTCNDLRSWAVILENWWASDGTAKYGLDVNNITALANGGDMMRRCRQFENISSTVYKRDCSKVNETSDSDVFLREYCNDLKTEAYSDNGLHAPTGVILRNKYLKTSNNCTIQFKLMYKYNKVNEQSGTLPRPVVRLFGGHFGLIAENATTAELAPAKLEVYRRNAYYAIGSDGVTGARFAYSFIENTEYTIQMKINSSRMEIKILELNDSVIFNGLNQSFTGLCPYIFAFTNGTELVIREMKIIPNQ